MGKGVMPSRGVCTPTAGPRGVSDSMPGRNSRALSLFCRGNMASNRRWWGPSAPASCDFVVVSYLLLVKRG